MSGGGWVEPPGEPLSVSGGGAAEQPGGPSSGRLRALGRDDGQVTILAIGLTVVAVLLVIVVAASARVHLERTRLLAVADLVALDAADSTTDRTYFADDGSRPGLPLTDASVRETVERYLRAHPEATQGLDDVTVEAAGTSDGRTAHVRLAAVAHPRFAGVEMPWQRGVRVEADAVARAS